MAPRAAAFSVGPQGSLGHVLETQRECRCGPDLGSSCGSLRANGWSAEGQGQRAGFGLVVGTRAVAPRPLTVTGMVMRDGGMNAGLQPHPR